MTYNKKRNNNLEKEENVDIFSDIVRILKYKTDSGNCLWTDTKNKPMEKHFKCDWTKLFGALGENECKYERNRYINEETIEKIVEYQKDYYKKHKKYSVATGKIVIGGINGKNWKILDGQHRIRAFSLLQDKGPAFGDITVINFDNEDEMFEAFKTLNESTPVPEQYKNGNPIHTEILQGVKLLFDKEYKDTISKADKPQRPNINSQKMIDRMAENINNDNDNISSIQVFYIKNHDNSINKELSIENIFKLIKKYNSYLSHRKIDFFPLYGGGKDIEKLKNTRLSLYSKINNKCYVGMYLKFEWINHMIARYEIKDEED